MSILLSLICTLTIGIGYFSVRTYNKLKATKKQLSLAENRLLEEEEMQRALSIELLELKETVSQNALEDHLTKLPSRGVFEDRLQLTLNQSQRYHLTFGVVFLDLDGFKMINDALGHDAGDELLREVAKRLLTCIRQVDTVSRFGGDEFVFILPQLSKAETAAYVAQRLLDSISQPFKIHDQELYITASIGIAVYPNDGDNNKTILKNAATALHQAKSRGRNTYQFYRTEMHTMSQRELMLSSSLRSELIYQDFSIYYQLQLNVDTKEITSMESLLRWQHPDFGLIAFSEFSRLAENSGKIAAIEEWLIRNTLRHLIQWKASGFMPKTITVPVSLKQLEHNHFVHKISTILQEINLPAESLMLEIAETTLDAKIEAVEKVLYMLKHMGIQISINNFGTGHLSLQNLRRLPVDCLKIDATFIQDMTINKESAAIVKMVIALAKSLQISAVAEGVESLKQKQMLQELGCSVMQGSLFGQPALANEFSNTSLQKIYQSAGIDVNN